MKTLEIPLLRGRDVASSDRDAMLVSASAAKLLWGTDDPIGRRVTLPLVSRTTFIEVVGVVGDVKESLAEKAPPTVYYYERDLRYAGFSLAIRTAGDPVTLARPAAAVVHALDPQLPVEDIRSMADVVEDTLVAERFRALLLQVFAAAALTLASVGIYSVLAYLVRGRRREIGIRTALGAGTTDVVRMVLIEGMKPALLGIGIGICGALAAARLLENLVFGVKPYDPLTLAVVSAALLVIAALASAVPALRAARLDPVQVLRDA
jgi:putative ABC transport system permease protein